MIHKRKITKAITTAFFFTVLMITYVACDTHQGMMHGDSSMGMNYWNWTQILIGIGIVCLIGFLTWFIVSRRKK